jgi:Fe-S cluster biosynthesis and repair protein YggX
MSGASHISKTSKNQNQPKYNQDYDQMSMTSSQAPPLTEAYSEINEDDEWTAIQKFNTLLHYEEQKQSMMRDRERKRLIKQELDKQLQEKKQRKMRD